MQYISDIIDKQEIETNWKIGSKILLTSQTGKGKSHFIKTVLLEYCKENKLRILLLSNRKALKNQNEEELRGEEDYITLMNYQALESNLIQSEDDLEYLLRKFNVIVLDEVHYIFSDSEFSRSSDLLLETLHKNYPDKLMVFITATPEILLEYNPTFDKTYSTKRDYSYINKISFFGRDKTPEEIIQNLPVEEKVIYFSSDAQEAYELSQKFDDASFVCADNNQMSRYSNQNTLDEIAEKSYFSNRILCCTKVLDSGINIIDKNVTTIIIDSLDILNLVQALGRKRITDKNEKINLYIKNYHSGNVNYNLMIINSKLATVEELETYGKEEFQKAHKKISFHDVIDNDFTINKAKLIFYKYKKEYLEKIKKTRDGYKTEVLRYFNIKDESAVGNADNEFEKIGIRAYLEKLKNIKLYKDEQESFKVKFFSLLFSPKNTNYRNRGLRSITAILEEDSIPYRLTSGKDNKGVTRDKRWWMVIDVASYDNE